MKAIILHVLLCVQKKHFFIFQAKKSQYGINADMVDLVQECQKSDRA